LRRLPGKARKLRNIRQIPSFSSIVRRDGSTLNPLQAGLREPCELQFDITTEYYYIQVLIEIKVEMAAFCTQCDFNRIGIDAADGLLPPHKFFCQIKKEDSYE